MKHILSSIDRRLHHLAGSDVMLNVSLKESFFRGLGAIFVLIPALTFTDQPVLFICLPIIAYLYVTALCHFCIVKYAWRHWLHHETDPLLPDLPPELYVPGNNG